MTFNTRGCRRAITTGAERLTEDLYVASISTMYRILRANGEVRERRAQATHPTRARPELTASAPNQCWSWSWSWDIERHEALRTVR